ncbi:hypothetical protein, partial [Comamonas guangdongensis]
DGIKKKSILPHYCFCERLVTPKSFVPKNWLLATKRPRLSAVFFKDPDSKPVNTSLEFRCLLRSAKPCSVSQFFEHLARIFRFLRGSRLLRWIEL